MLSSSQAAGCGLGLQKKQVKLIEECIRNSWILFII